MKFNGSFNYRHVGEVEKDPDTGFISTVQENKFERGCECQIDFNIPAKQIIGTDGQVFTYTFDVFIPKYFTGELSIGDKIQLIYGNGNVIDEFTIKGIDTINRKVIEIWG